MLNKEILLQQSAIIKAGIIPVGFAMVKPDGFKKLIMHEFEEELHGQNLHIETAFPIVLDKDSILGIFPHLLLPSEFGDEWKEDVLEALQDGPSIAYILSGENVVQHVLEIKKKLRGKHTDRTDYVQRVVKNLLHSSDSEDESKESIKIAIDKLDYPAGIDAYVKYKNFLTMSEANKNIYLHSRQVADMTRDILRGEKLEDEVDEHLIFAAAMLHHLTVRDVGNKYGLSQPEDAIATMSWIPLPFRRDVEQTIFDARRKPVITSAGKILFDAHLINDIRNDIDAEKFYDEFHYEYSSNIATRYLRN